jgi:predicted dehydrogenase
MIQEVLLVGASQMAIDYYKVLSALEINTIVIGRSQDSALNFEEVTNHKVITGGLEKYLIDNSVPETAIISTGVEQLASNAITLINAGVKNILIEKPGATNKSDLINIQALAKKNNTKIFIAYNRRFYASVIKAQEMIASDGGPLSFNFEFTEWAFKITPLHKKEGVKETWFISNSTHVVDMAFHLGGTPISLNAYSSGRLDWHKKSVFAGSGLAESGALFSYLANWEAPGRWSVEIQTKQRRYILKPLEELYIQEIGSIAINKLEINDRLDKEYKPGLYLQTKAFLNGEHDKLKSLNQQVKDFTFYETILEGGNLNS